MSSQYRSPECMPDGAGPGVGSEQSGALIAEELYQRGQRTFLAATKEWRTPLRHRGAVIVEWLALATFFVIAPEKLPVLRVQFVARHVSLRDEGRTLYLHEFARDCKAAMVFSVDADRNVCIVDWESGRIVKHPLSGASHRAASRISSSGTQSDTRDEPGNTGRTAAWTRQAGRSRAPTGARLVTDLKLDLLHLGQGRQRPEIPLTIRHPR